MQLLRSIFSSQVCKPLPVKRFSPRRAFTLVELIVTVSIFAFITTLVISKYGTFNQNVLLTNLAYDMALTIRTAQTFGVSVKTSNNLGNPCYTSSTPFQCVYGVHFDYTLNNSFTLYSIPILVGNTYHYPGSANDINQYTLKSGGVISNIYTCTVSNNSLTPDTNPGGCTAMGTSNVDIYFKRPDSSSHICTVIPASGAENCTWSSAYIKIGNSNTPTNYRWVVVFQNGQISVQD